MLLLVLPLLLMWLLLLFALLFLIVGGVVVTIVVGVVVVVVTVVIGVGLSIFTVFRNTRLVQCSRQMLFISHTIVYPSTHTHTSQRCIVQRAMIVAGIVFVFFVVAGIRSTTAVVVVAWDVVGVVGWIGCVTIGVVVVVVIVLCRLKCCWCCY